MDAAVGPGRQAASGHSIDTLAPKRIVGQADMTALSGLRAKNRNPVLERALQHGLRALEETNSDTWSQPLEPSPRSQPMVQPAPEDKELTPVQDKLFCR